MLYVPFFVAFSTSPLATPPPPDPFLPAPEKFRESLFYLNTVTRYSYPPWDPLAWGMGTQMYPPSPVMDLGKTKPRTGVNTVLERGTNQAEKR